MRGLTDEELKAAVQMADDMQTVEDFVGDFGRNARFNGLHFIIETAELAKAIKEKSRGIAIQARNTRAASSNEQRKAALESWKRLYRKAREFGLDIFADADDVGKLLVFDATIRDALEAPEVDKEGER